MAKFMLILQSSPHAYEQLPPERMRQTFDRFNAWADKLRSDGRLVSSEKLMEEGGKILEPRADRLSILDGPYMETKEVIGGYFVLRAANYNEAVELARDCPFLEFGRIAIRQTDPRGCGGE